jgi:hypothetical protein
MGRATRATGVATDLFAKLLLEFVGGHVERVRLEDRRLGSDRLRGAGRDKELRERVSERAESR